MSKSKGWVGVDFDWTIWHSEKGEPMPGARESLSELREAGYKILIFSCNQPGYIKQCLRDADIMFDGIWGEVPSDSGKPNCRLFIDDKGLRFNGDWQATLAWALDLLEEE